MRSRQKEQIQVRMAEAEKYAKLREERLQKKLEETVKKEERRRQEEEELFDIEQEIEEIRKSMFIRPNTSPGIHIMVQEIYRWKMSVSASRETSWLRKR